MRNPFCRRAFLAAALVLSAWHPAWGAEPPEAPLEKDRQLAAQLFPTSTVLYAELPDPPRLLQTLLEHPLRKRLESLPAYEQALQEPQYLRFRAVVAVIEGALGMSWQDALATTTEGGMFAGTDAKTGGLALMTQARDEQKLSHIVNTLVRLSREEASRKGQADDIVADSYRGIDIYKINGLRVALLDHWLLLTNHEELGQLIVDRYLDPEQRQESLADNKQFQAVQSQNREHSAWAYVDLDSLRKAGAAKGLFTGQANNPLSELLMGGLLPVLQQSPHLQAALDVSPQTLQVSFQMPHEPSWVGQERSYFFGPPGGVSAPAPLPVSGKLLEIRIYRNLSEMWLYAPDLFNERINAQIAQAESNLSTLFGGRDFAEEILGAFQPQIQLVAVRQDFEGPEISVKPAIRLPAGALIFRLKDPETMQPELRRTFQSLIGFLNIVGAMNGQPQLDLDLEKGDQRQIVIARYLPSDADRQSEQGRLNFNFSPTVAFVGDRFIVSSTEQLARQLAGLEALTQPAAKQAERDEAVNTEVALDVQLLRQVLQDNRDQLVAQNMLSEGHDQGTAEQQIDGLLELLEVPQRATIQLQVEQDHLRLEVKASFGS